MSEIRQDRRGDGWLSSFCFAIQMCQFAAQNASSHYACRSFRKKIHSFTFRMLFTICSSCWRNSMGGIHVTGCMLCLLVHGKARSFFAAATHSQVALPISSCASAPSGEQKPGKYDTIGTKQLAFTEELLYDQRYSFHPLSIPRHQPLAASANPAL